MSRPDCSPQKLVPKVQKLNVPDEKEVIKVLEELEDIQNNQPSKGLQNNKLTTTKPTIEVVRLGALVGGFHPTVPKAKALSAAEKVALWKARRAPDCVLEDIVQVPTQQPDWDDLVPYSILGPISPCIEEDNVSQPLPSLGHLSSPCDFPQSDGDLDQRRPARQEKKPQSSCGGSSRSGAGGANLQAVLARLASLEQQLKAEREGTNAIVDKFDLLLREREEAHARDVAALREMIVVAHSRQFKGGSTASGSKSTCSVATSSSLSCSR